MDSIIIGAIIAAAGAMAVPVIAYFLGRNRNSKKKRKYEACVILGGIGESGKSTLIERLLPGVDAKAGSRTQVLTQFEEYKQMPGTDQYCNIVFIDYRGQNLSQLTGGLINPNFKIPKPTAFILIVDPIINGQPGDELELNFDRINQHCVEWSHNALSGFSPLIEDVKYVCLFINKIDALNVKSKKALDNSFESLFKNLQDIFSSVHKIEMIKGSALQGTMVSEIVERILGSSRRVI